MLSGTDRDRLKVLHEAKRKQITQGEAGERLKLRERWVRRLLARRREEGESRDSAPAQRSVLEPPLAGEHRG